MPFNIYKKRCAECLFGKNRIVSKERMQEVLQDCETQDTYFICHKATLQGEEVACRGWYDSGRTSRSLRFARYLGGEKIGLIQFIPLPENTKDA